MKVKALALSLAVVTSAAFAAGSGTEADPVVFNMPLYHEIQKPAGVKNGCVYGWKDLYTIVVLALDANKACHKSITWKEWDFSHNVTGAGVDCSYDFPTFGEVLAHDFSDHVTKCFKRVNIQFHVGTAI